MRNHSLFSTFAVIAASIAVATPAFALEPLWGLKPDKNTPGVTTVAVGETVEVRALVDEQGSFKAPAGWSTRFSTTKVGGGPMECALIKRPATCGVWISKAPVSATTSATFSYTPPTGASVNKTFTINVDQPPAPPPPANTGSWYPADSGKKLEDRVTVVEKSKESVSLYMHYQMVPNLSTTTAPGHGFLLGVRALVVDTGAIGRFSVGGQFGWMRTRIPMEMDMKPVVTEGSEDRYQFAATLGWTPCVQIEDGGTKRDFACFNVGALIGGQVYSYSNQFVRAIRDNNGVLQNTEYTRERTQASFMMGPALGFGLKITRNFGFGLGFELPVDVTSVSRIIGEGTGNGGSVQSTATGSPMANPTFHGGLDFAF